MFRNDFLPSVVVNAYPTPTAGRSRVVVRLVNGSKAKHLGYQRAVEAFVEREFVNRGADDSV